MENNGEYADERGESASGGLGSGASRAGASQSHESLSGKQTTKEKYTHQGLITTEVVFPKDTSSKSKLNKPGAKEGNKGT